MDMEFSKDFNNAVVAAVTTILLLLATTTTTTTTANRLVGTEKLVVCKIC